MLLIIRESTLRIRLPIGVGRLAHDNRDRTFEQHGGAGELMGPQRPMQWLVLHIRRIHILAPGGEQRGELPGVRVMTTCGGTSSGSRSRAPASTTSGGIS